MRRPKVSLSILVIIILLFSHFAGASVLIVMRHGEAKQNIEKILNGDVKLSQQFPLTEKGKKQVHVAARNLKTKIGINSKTTVTIFSSPFLRTRQTAEILALDLGLNPSQIIIDDLIRENGMGRLEGHSETELDALEGTPGGYLQKAHELFGGENKDELLLRLKSFLKKVSLMKSDNIIVITHGTPAAELLKLIDPSHPHLPELKRGEYRVIKDFSFRL